MAITSWRPVTIPHDASPSIRTALEQLNRNGRLLSECQQDAVTSGADAVNAVFVGGTGSTGAAVVLGTYFHRGATNGQANYHCNVAGANMWVYYASDIGKWVIAATTGTSPPADHWYSGTAGTGGLVATYTASGGTYSGSPTVERALIDVQMAAILTNQNLILAALRALGLIAE